MLVSAEMYEQHFLSHAPPDIPPEEDSDSESEGGGDDDGGGNDGGGRGGTDAPATFVGAPKIPTLDIAGVASEKDEYKELLMTPASFAASRAAASIASTSTSKVKQPSEKYLFKFSWKTIAYGRLRIKDFERNITIYRSAGAVLTNNFPFKNAANVTLVHIKLSKQKNRLDLMQHGRVRASMYRDNVYFIDFKDDLDQIIKSYEFGSDINPMTTTEVEMVLRRAGNPTIFGLFKRTKPSTFILEIHSDEVKTEEERDLLLACINAPYFAPIYDS